MTFHGFERAVRSSRGGRCVNDRLARHTFWTTELCFRFYSIDSHMGSSNNTAVLATGAALLAIGVGLLTMGSSSKSNSNELTIREITDADDGGDNDDIITEDDVTDVFEKIFLEAQNKTAIVMQQVQQLQRMGNTLPEGQIQAALHETLTSAIETTQKAALEAAGIDEDCFEEAVWEFVVDDKNRKVITAVERLQRLWQSTTGEPVVGWTPGRTMAIPDVLSPQETIVVAHEYYTALTNAIKSVVLKFQNNGHNMQSPSVQQELNMAAGTIGAQLAEEALQNMNVTQVQFEASVKAHSDNEDVARAITMLNLKQRQELQAIGL